MKRYVLFSGGRYYPAGGFNDAVGTYDSREEALAALRASIVRDGWLDDCRWDHVVDLHADLAGCVEDLSGESAKIASELGLPVAKAPRRDAQ